MPPLLGLCEPLQAVLLHKQRTFQVSMQQLRLGHVSYAAHRHIVRCAACRLVRPSLWLSMLPVRLAQHSTDCCLGAQGTHYNVEKLQIRLIALPGLLMQPHLTLPGDSWKARRFLQVLPADFHEPTRQECTACFVQAANYPEQRRRSS